MIARKKLQQGFTLIEMIVSVAIFSIVATITVGALLVLIATNQQLQTEQSIMTNLSFALDSMTREIRTGTNYYCASRPNYSPNAATQAIFNPTSDHEGLGVNNLDCPGGNSSNNSLQGVSIIESGNSITTDSGETRILYFYDSGDYSGGSEVGRIMRRVGNGTPESIVSSGLDIVNAEFFVTGSTRGDNDQPTVTIVIEARDIDDASGKTYEMQTTVVQRALDI